MSCPIPHNQKTVPSLWAESNQRAFVMSGVKSKGLCYGWIQNNRALFRAELQAKPGHSLGKEPKYIASYIGGSRTPDEAEP